VLNVLVSQDMLYAAGKSGIEFITGSTLVVDGGMHGH
jgi:hypothetical protein